MEVRRVPQGRGVDQFRRAFTARLKILSVLSEGPAVFSRIVEETGMSSSTVSKYLREMMGTGEVERDGDGRYRLSDPDLVSPLHPICQSANERKVCREFLYGKVDPLFRAERLLHARGYCLDLQPWRSLLKSREVGLMLRDPAEAFLQLGRIEREYLTFLARLYVFSVLKMKDKHAFLEEERTEIPFTFIRAAWQLADGMKEQNDCFIFDFEGAWSHFIRKISWKLKWKLEERELTLEKIYRKLRVFSFPIAEKAEMLRRQKRRCRHDR